MHLKHVCFLRNHSLFLSLSCVRIILYKVTLPRMSAWLNVISVADADPLLLSPMDALSCFSWMSSWSLKQIWSYGRRPTSWNPLDSLCVKIIRRLEVRWKSNNDHHCSPYRHSCSAHYSRQLHPSDRIATAQPHHHHPQHHHRWLAGSPKTGKNRLSTMAITALQVGHH